MNEYNLDEITHIGGWFMPDNLCDDIVDYFNNNKNLHAKGVVNYGGGEKGKQTIKPVLEIKDSIELSVGQFDNHGPFTRYRDLLQECLINYVKKLSVSDLKKHPCIKDKYKLLKSGIEILLFIIKTIPIKKIIITHKGLRDAIVDEL